MKLSSSTVFSLTVLDVAEKELEKAEQHIQYSEGVFCMKLCLISSPAVLHN